MYKCAIFDLDGVLTETSEQHFEAWKVLADELGIDFDREYNEHLKGVSRMESLELILKNGNKTDAYSDEEKAELATRKNELYKELIAGFTPDNLFEGVRELFDILKSKGIKIALASASRNAPALIKNMGIAEDFDVVVDPTSVEKGKPDPAIFLQAPNTLGIDPKDCIGFEDAYAGVTAIKSAGMYAIGIGSKDNLPHADVVYPHIKDVDIKSLLN